MVYLKRKADSVLNHWRANSQRKPLIIKGARQVGKTAAVRCFAKKNYDSFIEINFVEQPKFRSITQDGYAVGDIIKNLTLLEPSLKFVEGKTLIFFDELQAFPDIATSLKFFQIDGRYDVICSGSLLGINYKQIESNSVGYKTDYIMRSLDFEEFLWAKGYDENVAERMLQQILNLRPFSDIEMSTYMGLFRDFCVVGGMPAVVSNYLETGTFEGVLEMQRQLIQDYKEAVRKYATGVEQTRILNVFHRVPVQLGKDVKKFQISKVAHGSKAKDYWGCVEWLVDAGIVNICYCMNFPELPLKGNFDESKYKLYFADTGLLIACLDDEVQYDLRANQNLGTYKGSLYENAVAEALIKSGLELFYYKRQDSTLEEEFFVRNVSNLIPVEVKSENKRSKSLRTLIESDKYTDIAWGIKLVNGNIGFQNNMLTVPYFCAFVLKSVVKEIKLKTV